MDNQRIFPEATEPFYISPETLQTLDEAMKELENGCKLQTLDLSRWDKDIKE